MRPLFPDSDLPERDIEPPSNGNARGAASWPAFPSPDGLRPLTGPDVLKSEQTMQVEGVDVYYGVQAPMRDGVLLASDVYIPPGAGAHPVLLRRTPYGRQDNELSHPLLLARHGYIVVSQDCRGRGDSEGEFYPFATEATDGFDTVEWAGRLPRASGKVGMFGSSYLGATQLLAAAERPPSLAAIAPALTGSQYFEGWLYHGGVLRWEFALSWARALAVDAAARRGDSEALATLRSPQAAAEELWQVSPDFAWLRNTPYFEHWLEHDEYDDYWRQWSIEEQYGSIDVPALHIGGWYDTFLAGTVRNFTGLGAEAASSRARELQKLVILNLRHTSYFGIPSVNSPQSGRGDVDEYHLRFFDVTLKGGSGDGVFDRRVTLQLVGGGVVELDEWPGSRDLQRVYLSSGGRANTSLGDGHLVPEPDEGTLFDVYVYDPGDPAPSAGGHSCCADESLMGPSPQETRENRADVLVYTSGPVEGQVLIGDVDLEIFAQTSSDDTHLAARLCVVDPAGVSRNLAEGILSLSWWRKRESSSGGINKYVVPLGSIGVRLFPGSRLRVQVSGADFPQYRRSLSTGGSQRSLLEPSADLATHIIYHDADRPSALRLPAGLQDRLAFRDSSTEAARPTGNPPSKQRR